MTPFDQLKVELSVDPDESYCCKCKTTRMVRTSDSEDSSGSHEVWITRNFPTVWWSDSLVVYLQSNRNLKKIFRWPLPKLRLAIMQSDNLIKWCLFFDRLYAHRCALSLSFSLSLFSLPSTETNRPQSRLFQSYSSSKIWFGNYFLASREPAVMRRPFEAGKSLNKIQAEIRTQIWISNFKF